MNALNRREFLSAGARLAALFGLGGSAVSALAEAAAQMASGAAPVLWLQGQSCSGCSVSLLNSDPLSPAQLLTRYIALGFHQTLSTATGHVAVKAVNDLVEKGGFILAVEGSVPAGMPAACEFAGEPFAQQFLRAARKAQAVVAVGTCACHGGIPAAPGGPTGAVSLAKCLETAGVTTPWINVPGCPTHPDWIVGTLAHVLKFGLPPLDSQHRPKAFFARTVHDQCPRFADYEQERFATKFGDPGCLFKLGCLGPVVKADCPVRQWNSGTSFCMKAGVPCVACASPHFCARKEIPMFVHNKPSAAKGHA